MKVIIQTTKTKVPRIQKEFLDAKEQALCSLDKACTDHHVDDDILPILNLLNKTGDYYTSSSCAGRIMTFEIPSLGDKQRARILGKWHRTIRIEELFAATQTAQQGMIWLLAQAPILHIGCSTLEAADMLVKLSGSCGFKNSSVKSTGKKIIVEICSTERLDAPIGKDGILFCDDRYLQLLTDISNKVIERSQMKLKRFEKKLRNI